MCNRIHGSMMIRSSALVPALLLAATLSADGATTALVADTLSPEVQITRYSRVAFFTFTPASDESVTFSYIDNVRDDPEKALPTIIPTSLQAFAKRGGCPTDSGGDSDFENEIFGEIYVDPCSGSGEICFMVTSGSSYFDIHQGLIYIRATATVSTAPGAMSVVLGATVASASLHSGMNNFKFTLPSNFDPAASKP